MLKQVSDIPKIVIERIDPVIKTYHKRSSGPKSTEPIRDTPQPQHRQKRRHLRASHSSIPHLLVHIHPMTETLPTLAKPR